MVIYGGLSSPKDSEACSARDILSFLVYSLEHTFLKAIFCGKIGGEQFCFTRSTISALFKLEILCFSSTTRPNYFERDYSAQTGSPTADNKTMTLLRALEIMSHTFFTFNNNVLYLKEWICNGWICPQSGEQSLYHLVDDLHIGRQRVRKVAYRIARQLLALGIFREPVENPNLEWPRRCFYNENYSFFKFLHHLRCWPYTRWEYTGLSAGRPTDERVLSKLAIAAAAFAHRDTPFNRNERL